jgi:hypothetical protein
LELLGATTAASDDSARKGVKPNRMQASRPPVGWNRMKKDRVAELRSELAIACEFVLLKRAWRAVFGLSMTLHFSHFP